MSPLQESVEQCEVCGANVIVRLARAPAGMPDFVRPVLPEGAWLGWTWSGLDVKTLGLIVLCSQLCLTQWFEDIHGLGTISAEKGSV